MLPELDYSIIQRADIKILMVVCLCLTTAWALCELFIIMEQLEGNIE